jgi:hypothetical protein
VPESLAPAIETDEQINPRMGISDQDGLPVPAPNVYRLTAIPAGKWPEGANVLASFGSEHRDELPAGIQFRDRWRGRRHLCT